MKRRFKIFVVGALLLAILLPGVASAQHATTQVDDAYSDRYENIRLAVEAIDGSQIAPGETFSFNQTVGERTEPNGYITAQNGRGVLVVGGGVAQAATTLYLAVKDEEDIEIKEHHSYGKRFKGGYVDDGALSVATDDQDNLDFRFRNRSEETLYISMWLYDDVLECSVGPVSSNRIVMAQIHLKDEDTAALRNNIMLACQSVYGTTLAPGEVFSFNEAVGERSEKAGYKVATNGRDVRVVGGGVAQLASAIYLAAEDLDQLEIEEKHSYGDRYNQSYVDDADDAVLVDYGSGLDLKIANRSDQSVTLYTYINDGRQTLECEVYVED